MAERTDIPEDTRDTRDRRVSPDLKGTRRPLRSRALSFVLIVGVMSLFSDLTHEGSRSILGPYLGLLGASAAVVGIVTGFGELLGYGWRLVSGRLSDRTHQFWPIIIFGYVIQMISVPLMALAGSWPVAAVLIMTERMGRATRNPPRDTLLAHAAKEVGGYGHVFGIHQALDQFGALAGPLVVAAVLALHGGPGDYQVAFATLAIPATLTLIVLAIARFLYPRPEDLETTPPEITSSGLPRVFWVYLAGAALVAMGFADFPLIAFHFQQANSFPGAWVPALYAVAMGVSGAGSLLFGRLFDRFGLRVLVPLTAVSAFFAPLVFLGGFWSALMGMTLWGLGMGVHESIIPAAVGLIVPAQRRASAYGLFTAGYGIFWFLGSAIIGLLYGVSIPAVIIFSIVVELAAIPFFLRAWRRITPAAVA